MPTVGRLIIDAPASGAWNMATDAAILQSHQSNDPPTLRFYRWAQPTLSLGYFQSVNQRTSHLESQNIEVVRRATGGGAIVHDQELTYSLTIASDSRSIGTAGASAWLYRMLHQCVIEALHTLGVTASCHGTSAETPNRSDGVEPFLCFQRRTSEDLIVSGYKILGSAQRRGREAILQHGGLLLAASRFAPQLPGILDLVGMADHQTEPAVTLLGSTIALEIAKVVGQVLDLEWTLSAIGLDEQNLAVQFEQLRFGTEGWLAKR